jgi:hypothetical protein
MELSRQQAGHRNLTEHIDRRWPLPPPTDDLLARAAFHAPPGLLGPDAWQSIGRLRPLLAPPIAIAAFECRLEAVSDRIDLEVCIRDAERESFLAGLDATPLSCATGPAWERVLGVLRRWNEPESVLFDGIEVAWLEFDLERDRPPAWFVVLTLRRDAAGDDGQQYRRDRALLDGCLEALSDGLDDDVIAAVHRCVDELRPVGRLLHVAVRPTLHGDVVRLIALLPRQTLAAYLERAGWAGDGGDLGRILEHLCPPTMMHSVNLDIRAGVGPRIGIEYHFRTAPFDDPRWQSLFDGLIEFGACTREKRELVSRWSPSPIRHEHDPMPLMRELLVKVDYETGQPLRAKAYLAFALRPAG